MIQFVWTEANSGFFLDLPFSHLLESSGESWFRLEMMSLLVSELERSIYFFFGGHSDAKPKSNWNFCVRNSFHEFGSFNDAEL